MVVVKYMTVSVLFFLDVFFTKNLIYKKYNKEKEITDIKTIDTTEITETTGNNIDNNINIDNPNYIFNNDNFNNINFNYDYDNENISYNVNDKYNIIINETKNTKKIHVAFATDNNYIYPLIVLMTSILINSSPKTIYSFHFLIPYDFLDKNKIKIINLTKKYPKHKCELKFYNLGHKYIGWTVYGNYSQTVYYRLALSDICNDLDKIIYLDCDTLVHNDLSEFYNIKMEGYYYMGFCGHDMTYRVFNGTRNFINSGVMLINLKELRKIDAPSKFKEYYYSYGTEKVDEYLINAIFYDKIKFLPFKYGIPDFEPDHDIIGSPSIFWKSLKGYCNGTFRELLSSSKNRTITHGAYKDIKWWSRDYYNLSKIGKQWIYYASKSNVFDEICNKYKQYKKVCKILKEKK